MSRIDWGTVVEGAGSVAGEYDTPVTLRQLFYRLVAAAELPNTLTAYKGLSRETAAARRAGTFRDLEDNGREIHAPLTFESPDDALGWLRRLYRRDRTEFQDTSVYLGVEKNTMVAQLRAWFGEQGLPVIALRGYASQTYVDEIVHDATRHDRPAVLLYAGDFDPSGEDILRDFLDRTGACFADVVRVALSAEQVAAYGLPSAPGKTTDTRAKGFAARHGQLVQVELEALDPTDLRRLYEEALDPFWDMSAFERSLAREAEDRAELAAIS